jgi:hypothetical protein
VKNRAANGGLKLRWFGENGKRYLVERSSDLKSWNKVAGDVAGGGDIKEVTDSTTGATLFYRVRVQP